MFSILINLGFKKLCLVASKSLLSKLKPLCVTNCGNSSARITSFPSRASSTTPPPGGLGGLPGYHRLWAGKLPLEEETTEI